MKIVIGGQMGKEEIKELAEGIVGVYVWHFVKKLCHQRKGQSLQ